MESLWKEKSCDIENIKKLFASTKISPITLRVLENRGMDTVEKIERFLKPSLENLYDPLLMKDMDKALDITLTSIKNKEKIVIYGDYDADGVTSTAILYKALKRCNAKVDFYIPHREQEGYGMSVERVEAIAKEGFNLIITCDNGISAINEVKRAKELGLKIIITDHHELPFLEEDGIKNTILPCGDAIVNPKQKDCKYPFKILCGAGIAYKFAIALYEKFNIPFEETMELLELAAIGTICDVVDLIDENRIIAKVGLELLSSTKNQGLNALKQIIGIDKQVSCYNVGFNIGPCINATGRLETAKLSLELLLCQNKEKAVELAQNVFNLNKERQDITNISVEEACEIVENSTLNKDKILVIYKESIHESIAGIVAGRIKEKYGKPTFVLTKGKDMPKGSGRSIEEYNMFDEMIKCKELLYKFGGHPMAAGLSIYEENIDLFRKKINENTILQDSDLCTKIYVDSPIGIQYITEEVIREFKTLAPFGKGNPSPVLMANGVKVNEINFIGKENQHVKFKFNIPKTQNLIDGLFFNKSEEVKELLQQVYGDSYVNHLYRPYDLYMDVLFEPDINEFNGRKQLQLKIKDIKVSKI